MSIEQVSVPHGYCQCGCGSETPVATRNKVARGYVKGEPIRFIAGHQNRRPTWQRDSALQALRERWRVAGIRYGDCLCGCGERTNIASRTNATLGHITGEPYPYRVGHKKDADRYRIEDRGYQTPCWIWQKWTGQNGYGYVKRAGEQILAHRLAYEEIYGPIPAGYHVHHRCETRRCVNPDHLEPLTPRDHRRRHAGAVRLRERSG